MKPIRRYRGAFTLVELLVVVAIVALLISIMLPALGKSRNLAKGVVCLANQRTMGQAVAMYADMYREHYPVSSHTAGSINAPGAWLTTLEPFGFTRAVRLCTMDASREQRLTSYATNEHFEQLTPGIDYNPVTRKPLPGGRPRAYRKLTDVFNPSAVYYAFEPSGKSTHPGISSDGTVDHLMTHQFVTPGDVADAVAVSRHLGSGHFLYADSHAASLGWHLWGVRYTPEASPFDPATAR